jgi:tetratricopeptide (TPR) repeat protein
MKKTLLIIATLLLGFFASAQTQYGYVKTKGRIVNGKLERGHGLNEVTVTIKGHNKVLVNRDDGAFSFPITEKTFLVQSVKKSGYQLVDADAISHPIHYSANPLYLVMEIPEKQLQDELDIERKLRHNIQWKLQQREEELNALKESHEITVEEYQAALKKIYEDTDQNERLVKNMVEHYSKIDYDQLSEFDQQISELILNGELTQADSMLRTKGDIKERIALYHKLEAVNAIEKEELAQKQEQLEQREALALQECEELANDCKKYFDICELNMEWDSAAYYIKLCAELDTTNAEWQLRAASYLQEQNQFYDSEQYYSRGIRILRELAAKDPYYDKILAAILSQFSTLYIDLLQFPKSEALCLEALQIQKQLANEDPQHNLDVAISLKNLGLLYYKWGRLPESETMFLEAVGMMRQLAQTDPIAYEPELANTLNNLAILYHSTQRSETESVFLETLDIYRRLAQNNPRIYEPDLADALDNLAAFYHSTWPEESEEKSLEALAIYRRLAKNNPNTYEPELAKSLNNLALLYENTDRPKESETMYLEAREILERLAKDSPWVYDYDLASASLNLGNLYASTGRIKESEMMYLEALEIFRQLERDTPQTCKRELALTLFNLGMLMSEHDEWFGEGFHVFRHKDAIQYFEDALGYYRDLALTDPNCTQYYIYCLYMLSSLYPITNDPIKQYELNEEWLPFLEMLSADSPEEWMNDYINTLGNQSLHCLFANQFEKSEQYARKVLSLDPSLQWINTPLASALLFQGKYKEAEQIYRQYKDALKDNFLQDLDAFEAAGVIPEERKTDVERIRKMLNE